MYSIICKVFIYLLIHLFIIYTIYIIYHWVRTIIFDYLLSVYRNLFITNLNFK